ncbi:hypothetical protein JX265_001681 [Neoarthrinium moseri]|uniref:Uncharacterized protein n=1 Tax=Neoarthrinium moseri TaxID=1658444 RepID=A0A9P9WVK9_9PEZI|nr:uncharacterized protein JN550_005254 [Neoarthrinium moseri]KAI1842967.1 hypothetical protein JX266_010820 [Neoarthrinium moseri]KAI1870326.1 hypothetical protein JN550_005254 [Neoarthrinium moseri]KAI1880060.1 hypothetical protein JX265_001681 [Neoarthrinium moseri]
MSANYSLLAIPAHWFISVVPHAYAMRLIKGATNGRWNNANPTGSAWKTEMQRSVPADVLAQFERAEAAHRNGFENLPLFAAAVLSGHVAGLDRGTLDTHAAAYLALRVLFTVLYINTSKLKTSYLRSLVWTAGVGICISLFVQAGLKA